MTPEIKQRIERIRCGEQLEGYKKTKAGTIPDAWCCYRIHECLSIYNHERKPISEDVRKTIPGPYPYYGPTQVQGYIATYESEGPAVLIGEDGDHFLKYKDREMTMYVDGKYTVNNHAHVLHGTELCETEWFYYAYQHKSLFDAITRQGAGRYKLTKEALTKLPLQCPPIEEQREIISILTTQDKVIDLKEKRLAEKQRQKKYLMQQLLTGKKRLLGFSGTWKKEILGKCASMCSGGTPDTKNEKYYGNDYIWISIKDMTSAGKYICSSERGLTEAGFLNCSARLFPKGTILFAMYASIGECSIAEVECCSSQAILGIEPDSKLNNEFLYYLLSNSKEYFKSFGQVSSQPNLNKGIVQSIVVQIPEIEEQAAIVEVLSAADREIDLLRQDIEQEKQKKKALMQLLLTGIVRVKT